MEIVIQDVALKQFSRYYKICNRVDVYIDAFKAILTLGYLRRRVHL